jgi:hypothetical protein
MIPEKTERLGSIFLAVVAAGLAALLAVDGMEPRQWFAATLAVTASATLAVAVRLWRQPASVKAARD